MNVYVLSAISSKSSTIIAVYSTWEHATECLQAFRELEQNDGSLSYSVEEFTVMERASES